MNKDKLLVEEPCVHEGISDTGPVSQPSPKLLALKSTSLASMACATSACGGGSSSTPPSANSSSVGISNPKPSPSTSDDELKGITELQRQSARAVLHSSLAVDHAILRKIEKIGFEKWLDEKMPVQNDISAEKYFSSNGYDIVDENKFWVRKQYFDYMIWRQLLSGGNSVRKRMALALSEIFVVSVSTIDMLWPAQAVGAYWDLLNQHAFGNFRDLIEAVSLNPAMGVFLDTCGNIKGDPSIGRVADENYARELMQLFTIGLNQLNQDGSLKLHNGQPVETYGNNDVEGLAKVFTGYNLDYSGLEFSTDPVAPYKSFPEPKLVRRPLTADPSRWVREGRGDQHCYEEKRFLGISIPAGTGARESLRIALDTLFAHPNVGPFIGKQLIQRLVTSNPSPSYVHRVAAAFNNNGEGVRGDLRATFKAVVLDPEATSSAGLIDPKFGKLREPMLRFAQWGQSLGAASSSGTWQIRDLSRMGHLNQAPFRAPSVFNFFRPGFSPPRSQIAANGMVAPEFGIVNESSVAGYVDFIWRTIKGDPYWTEDIRADYKFEIDMANDPVKLLDHLDLIFTAGQIRPRTKQLILSAIEDVQIENSDDDESKLRRVQIALMLVMTSNEYIVQK